MALKPTRSKSFSVDNISEIHAGSVDPSVSGISAPYGSIYLQNTGGAGAFWVKRGNANTDWNKSVSTIKNKLVVQKDPGPGEFSSIVAALASISDNTSINPYQIFVGAGVFTEDTIVAKPYVSILGSGLQQTIVQVDSSLKNTVELCDNFLIENMSIGGSTASGKSTFHYSGSTAGTLCFINRVKFLSSDILVHLEPSTATFSLTVTNSFYGGTAVYTRGFFATGTGGGAGRVLLIGCTTSAGTTAATEFATADGANCQIVVNASQVRNSVVGGDCFVARNGGALRLTSVNLNGWARAIYMPNTGAATNIAANGINFENDTLDIVVEHPNATGSINASPSYLKTQINNSSLVFIVGKDPKIITVAKKGGDFSSVKAAADSIVDSSISNRYIIAIGPGIFIEDQIDLPIYVSAVGASIQSTIIEPAGNHHVFNLMNNCEVSFLTIQNSAAGFAAIACLDSGNFTQAHKISIYDCDIGILATSVSQDSFCYAEYVDINNVYTHAIKVTSSNGFMSFLNAENFYTFTDDNNTDDDVLIDGPEAEIHMIAFGFLQGIGNNNGVRITNGGQAHIQGGGFFGKAIAVYSDSSGTGSDIKMDGVHFHGDNVIDIKIDNANTTGNFTGFVPISKVQINASSPFFITNKDSQIITVAKKGGDYSSVKTAIDNILDASISKPYLVSVGPGIFIEDQITMKPFIRVRGVGDQQTVITALDPNQIVFRGCDNSAVSSLFITGASGPSGKGVYVEGSGTFVPFLLEEVIFGANFTQLDLFANAAASIVQIRNCRMGGSFAFTNGFVIRNNPGFPAQLAFDAFIFQDVIPGFATGDLFNVSGTGCALVLSDVQLRTGSPTGNCIVLQDGAEARMQSTSIRGFTKGIWVKNVGAASFVRAIGIGLEGNTIDIQVDHPGTTGNYLGTADQNKVIIDPDSSFTVLYSDFSSGNIVVTGLLKLGFQGNTPTDVSTLIVESSTMGLLEGGDLMAPTGPSGGFNITVAEGFGYLETEPEILKRFDWDSDLVSIPPNSSRYIFFNENGILSTDAGFPDTKNNILLGRAITNSNGILLIDRSPLDGEHTSNLYDRYLREALGPVYASGSIVTENATPFHLNVTGGKYFLSMNRFLPVGGTNINFLTYYRDGAGEWVIGNTNATQIKYDNNSGTLQNLTTSYYVKHSLYIIGDGVNERYLLVFGQAEYQTLVEAQGADIPAPPSYFVEGICLIANIILWDGFGNISEIQDARPRIGFKATGTSAVSDHGSLTGLTDDDHPQYLLANGSRSMSGNLDMGGNQIINVGNVDGVNVSDHQGRHLPNGSDPMTTAAPIANLNGSSTNATGIANSYSRSDHSHAVDNATTLVAGFMSAADKIRINALSTTSDVVFNSLILSSLTANRVLVSDGSKSIVVSATTDTEIGYVSGVTSSIQTQLNDRELLSNKSTNTALGSSNTLYPTQNAVKTYVDTAITAAVVGLLDDRGNFDASGNVFPSTGGSGVAGAILKGDLWTISVAGTLGGSAVTAGDVVRALTDAPGQTAGNWAIAENNFGYVAENSANKSTDVALGTSNILYPTQNAVKTYADTKVAANGAITGATNTKITYDSKGLVTAGASAVLASSDFANQGTTSTVLHGNAAGNPSFGSVVDNDIGSHTSTKITITAKGQLNTAIVYTDQANVYGAFNQTFKAANMLIVDGSDATKVLTFLMSGQTAATTLTISSLNTASRTLQIPALSATDTIATLGLTQTFTAAKTFNDSTLLVRNPGNTFSYTFRSSAITADRDLTLPLTRQTEILAVQPTVTQSSPANPTGTTSTTGVMMGLAVAFTPVVTGRVKITIVGDVNNATNGRGSTMQIYAGTGTAPTNGAALTGTAYGANINMFSNSGNQRYPFTLVSIVTGLTIGTAIWVDMALASVTSGTSLARNVTVLIEEE